MVLGRTLEVERMLMTHFGFVYILTLCSLAVARVVDNSQTTVCSHSYLIQILVFQDKQYLRLL